MRHRPHRQRARTLYSALLHHCHPFCGVRCGNDFSLSLGGAVQSLRTVRIARDVDLSGDPDRWVYMGVEKGRAGMGVRDAMRGETPLASAAETAALLNLDDRRN